MAVQCPLQPSHGLAEAEVLTLLGDELSRNCGLLHHSLTTLHLLTGLALLEGLHDREKESLMFECELRVFQSKSRQLHLITRRYTDCAILVCAS